MKNLFFVFATLFLLLVSSSVLQATMELSHTLIMPAPVVNSELIGTWEIVVETPRGTRKGIMQIVQAEQGLIGHAKRDDFLITQKGGYLYWNNIVESPLGIINMKNAAQVTGQTMKGTAEMVEGPMKGEVFPFVGTRIRA